MKRTCIFQANPFQNKIVLIFSICKDLIYMIESVNIVYET